MSTAPDDRVWTFMGDPVDPPCPECGGRCVYNGNYFCTACTWALPDRYDDEQPVEVGMEEWFRSAYASLMRWRSERRDGPPPPIRWYAPGHEPTSEPDSEPDPKRRDGVRHGTRHAYNTGCRCRECTAENTRSMREYQRKRRSGLGRNW